MEDLQNLEPWKERNWDGKEVTVSIPKPFDLPKHIDSNPSMGVELELDRAIREIVQNTTRAIDAACVVAREKNCGVKVTKYYNSGRMFVEVTNEVPAGEIHYHDDFGTGWIYE